MLFPAFMVNSTAAYRLNEMRSLPDSRTSKSKPRVGAHISEAGVEGEGTGDDYLLVVVTTSPKVVVVVAEKAESGEMKGSWIRVGR